MWQIKDENHTIIIDPFDNIGYPLPKNLTADLVLSTHSHHDHNNFSLINGNFLKIDKPGSYDLDNIKIEGFESFHDNKNGTIRGKNTIFKIHIGNRIILHCGDIGMLPDDRFLNNLGKIDILMIPIGGIYTINGSQAKTLADKIKAASILPMHYLTEKLNFNLDKIDHFIDLYQNIVRLNSDEFDFDSITLDKTQVFIFKI
jgi:L-ascorbate metabolism protein UlaG (beta-lactamase superfamily)